MLFICTVTAEVSMNESLNRFTELYGERGLWSVFLVPGLSWHKKRNTLISASITAICAQDNILFITLAEDNKTDLGFHRGKLS